jgi:hypothetical protein
MSKAFTRETDELTEGPLTLQRPSPLPAGSKNYTTVQGHARLQQELKQLLSEPIKELTRQRTLEIEQSLKSAIVVAPPPPPGIRFYLAQLLPCATTWATKRFIISSARMKWMPIAIS